MPVNYKRRIFASSQICNFLRTPPDAWLTILTYIWRVAASAIE